MSIDKVHMQYVSSLYSVLICIVQLKGPKDQKHINTNVLIDTQYIYITYSIMCTGVFLN